MGHYQSIADRLRRNREERLQFERQILQWQDDGGPVTCTTRWAASFDLPIAYLIEDPQEEDLLRGLCASFASEVEALQYALQGTRFRIANGEREIAELTSRVARLRSKTEAVRRLQIGLAEALGDGPP